MTSKVIRLSDTVPVSFFATDEKRAPYDLTGCSAQLFVTKGSVTVAYTVAIADASAGRVEWTPPGDLALGASTAVLKVTRADGKIASFPEDSSITLKVIA